MTVEEKIYRCWRAGMGIGQTITAVRKTCGVRLAFEEVRRTFVQLAERFR